MNRNEQLRRKASGPWAYKLILAAALLMLSHAPGALAQQWTTNGNNINNTNPGNVGVGTSAPQTTLHVSTATTAADRGITNEQTSADGSSSVFTFRKSRAGGAALETDNVGNILATAHDGTGFVTGARFRFAVDGPVATGSVPTAIQFFTGTSASGIERMRINSAGNVGIGIAAPTARFHLVGASGVNGGAAPTAFLVTGGAGGNSQNAGGAGGELSFQGGAGGWNTTGSSLYWSGNGGAISLTGGTGGQHLFGVSHAGTGGAINITGGTGGAHNVAGYTGGVGGNLFLNGGAGGTGTTAGVAGNVILANVRGNVGVGMASPIYRLDVAGQANATALCIAGDCKTAWSQVGGSGSSQWTTGGSNISYTTGNVGIGTTAPAAKLSVGGAGGNVYNTDAWVENNMHVQGNEALTQGGRGRLRVGTAWGYAGLYAETASTTAQNDLVLGASSGSVRVGPNASVGAPSMNFLVPNGGVTVGTNAPRSWARLHTFGGNVFHQWSATAEQEYGFYTSIHNNHFVSNLYFDGQWKMITPGKGAFVSTAPLGGAAFTVYADNTSRAANANASFTQLLHVRMDGNVGIGTTDPAVKLDVVGAVNASGNLSAGGLCLGGDCKTAWSQVGGASQWATSGSNISYGAGNVGIGTTAPSTAKLVVAGAAGAEGLDLASSDQYANLRVIRNSNSSLDKDIFLQYGAGAGSKIHFYSNNSESMTLTGGSLGIGTTAPAAKLHVAGGARVDGTNGRVYQGVGAPVGARGLEFIEESPTVFSIRHHDPHVAWRSIALNPHGGSVGVGTVTPDTAVKLHVGGDVRVDGNIAAKYQDLAEWVPSRQQLRAGTVVVLDTERTNEVIASSRAYDTKVAGVISAQPGIALGEAGEGKFLVATTGRVRIKADASRGPIEVGDLLVTSDVEGLAMKSVPLDFAGTPLHRPGTIIGKALEPLASGTGEILVLLSLQ